MYVLRQAPLRIKLTLGCGDQTMESSGYKTLVKDYKDFPKPVFFSEYGCNEVLPRQFQEVEALYSPEMTPVFSGGLIYEFHQELNNYGLIEYDEQGKVHLLEDFHALKKAYSKVKVSFDKSIMGKELAIKKQGLFSKDHDSSTPCEPEYSNIMIQDKLPDLDEVRDIMTLGVSGKNGRFSPLTQGDLKNTFDISDVDGRPYESNDGVKINKFPLSAEEAAVIENKEPKPKGILGFFAKNEGR